MDREKDLLFKSSSSETNGNIWYIGIVGRNIDRVPFPWVLHINNLYTRVLTSLKVRTFPQPSEEWETLGT